MNKKTRFLTQSALIAALYVAMTYISAAMGLASGVIQVRISEALTTEMKMNETHLASGDSRNCSPNCL